jgi:CubicO group peptidase (beta-lactamase class C family)
MQRRSAGLLFIALILLALTACRQSSVEEIIEEASPVDVQALDAYLDEARQRHAIPGMAVVIVTTRGPVYVRGFGVDGAGNPITPRTPFRIASLSKSFTALAVMQLVEQGRIDLDAPVQTYLPDFSTANPTTAAQITVRHLLNQVSGLSEWGYRDPVDEGDLATRMADLRRARPASAPGSRHAYFNPNYDVLGRLVEVVSGQLYMDYLSQQVLEPAGMWETWGAYTSERAVPRGHLIPFRVGIPWDEFLNAPDPSGGLVSTADDMGRYLVMQLNGGEIGGTQLLDAENVVLMHTPRQGTSGYGMGWYVRARDTPVRVVEHGGALPTYAAQMFLLPEQGLGVALLFNENHLLSALWLRPALQDALIALLTGDEIPEQLPAARWIGLGVAVVVAGSVLGQVIKFMRVPAWRRRAARWSPRRRRWEAASPLLSLIWLPLVPLVAGLLMGRPVTYPLVFSFTPDFLAWLALSIGLDLLVALRRLWPARVT